MSRRSLEIAKLGLTLGACIALVPLASCIQFNRESSESGCADSGTCAVDDPLASMDDGFGGGSLSAAWTVLGGGGVEGSESVSGGDLVLDPIRGPTHTWYGGDAGILVYQVMGGTQDFKVTAYNARVHRRDNASSVTDRFQVGGLLIQSSVDATDWVHTGVGTGDAGDALGDYHIWNKSTVDGGTTQDTDLWNAAAQRAADLRLCKVGNEIRYYSRAVGATTWTENTDAAPVSPVTRSDLDGAGVNLNVGFFCYGYNDPPVDGTEETRCHFASVEWRSIGTGGAAECDTD